MSAPHVYEDHQLRGDGCLVEKVRVCEPSDLKLKPLLNITQSMSAGDSQASWALLFEGAPNPKWKRNGCQSFPFEGLRQTCFWSIYQYHIIGKMAYQTYRSVSVNTIWPRLKSQFGCESGFVINARYQLELQWWPIPYSFEWSLNVNTRSNKKNSTSYIQLLIIITCTMSLPAPRTSGWMCKDVWHGGEQRRSQRCPSLKGFLASSGGGMLWDHSCFCCFCLSENGSIEMRGPSPVLHSTCSWEVLGRVKMLVGHRKTHFSTSRPRLWPMLFRPLAACAHVPWNEVQKSPLLMFDDSWQIL